MSGRAGGAAKTRDGNVEAIRALVVTKRPARSVIPEASDDGKVKPGAS